MTAPDIFLSYNREDQAVAKRFADAFAAEGLNVWWDQTLRSGEAYDEVTEAALRAAKAVVVLWSPRSVVSRWVRAEATIADRCKTLVPVTIEACERPIMFELTQTADLSLWTGDAKDRAWQTFLGDVRRLVRREDVTRAAAIAAPEPPPTQRGERGEAPSLAVMPFTNRSGLAEDEVFAFGMVEDLIDALSRGAHLRVLSSSTTARFRLGALTDPAALGHELGVRYLLEGNVRRSGDELRVTAQLVETSSGAIVWIERFGRPLDELAALQEDLVSEVAGHLGTQVWRSEMERALKKPSDLSAWECIMRAQAALRQFNSETVGSMIEEASRAVAISEGYGPAHALLAHGLALAYMYQSPDDPAEVRRIRHHVDRALTSDGANALVLAHVADALNNLGQPDEGFRQAMRAIKAAPELGLTHLAAGASCVMLGRHDEALAHLAASRRVEPQSPYVQYSWNWTGDANLFSGRLAAAEAAYETSITLNPHPSNVYMSKAIIIHQVGRSDEALALMREARRGEPETPLELWELRFRRWWPQGSLLEGFIGIVRSLWAATEPDA